MGHQQNAAYMALEDKKNENILLKMWHLVWERIFQIWDGCHGKNIPYLLNWPNHLKPYVLVRWQPSNLQMPGWQNVGVTYHLVGDDVAHLGDDMSSLGC